MYSETALQTYTQKNASNMVVSFLEAHSKGILWTPPGKRVATTISTFLHCVVCSMVIVNMMLTPILPLAHTCISPLPDSVCDTGIITAEFVRVELVSVTGGEVGGVGIPANESDI